MNQLAAAPVDLGEDSAQLARLVAVVVAATMAALSLVAIVVAPTLPQFALRWLSLILAINAIGLALLALNRRGHPRLAARLLVITHGAIWTAILLTAGGVTAPAISYAIVLVLIAGLLLGERALLVTGFAAAAISLAIAGLAESQWLALPPVAPTPLSTWAACAGCLAIAIGVQRLASQRMRSALKRTEQELTEHQRTTDRLKVVTERLRLATEAGAIGVWDWDLRSNNVVWDARMCAMYGTAPTALGSVPYQTWAERVHPEDLGHTEQTLQGIIAGQDRGRLEFRIVRPDGTLRYIQGAEALVVDDYGHPVRMVGVNLDVTDQHLSETERLRLVHDLGERIKELTLLHKAARLLQSERPFDQALLAEVVGYLPAAWQYPEVCEARIDFGGLKAITPGWRESQWKQSVGFGHPGASGTIEIVYLVEKPECDEGPFLAEERTLLDSLAEMLDAHLEHRQATDDLRLREAEFRAIFEHSGIGMALKDLDGHPVRCNPALEQFLGYSAEVMAGMTFAEMTHPDDVEADLSLNRALLADDRDAYQIEKRYIRQDGQIVWGRLTASLVRDDLRRPRYVIGMVEDVNARKEYALQLQELAQASVLINSASSLSQALQLATDRARSIIGCHQALTSFTTNSNWAQSISAVSLSDKYASYREYSVQPDGSGIYALVCRENRHIRLTQAEMEQHPAWRAFGREAGRHPPMRGWLAVPLVGRDGGNIGLIQVSDKVDGEFNADDEAILIQLAQMVAVAVANARLFEEVLAAQQRQAALSRQLVEVQELERRRLAQEIHDDVSQSLTAIMLQLGLARRSLPETGGTAQPILEQTEVLTQETLNGVRRMIAGLRPPVLDELGLLPALRQLGHALQAANGVIVTIESVGLPDRLSSQFETALFRITQEALANVRKHARASRVSISLRAEDGVLSLSVQDDGVGLPDGGLQGQQTSDRVVAQGWRVAASHFGLIGIEERAAQLNGTLRLRSASGQGTWLRVEFPLEDIHADHRADLR